MVSRSKPIPASEVLTLSEGVEELWRATRPRVDILSQPKVDAVHLREVNEHIGQMSSRVRELLEQSEGETSLDEQIDAYGMKRNLPTLAARARILPHFGKEERRKLEQELQVYFSRLDIPAMMERGDEQEIAETVTLLKVLRNEGFVDLIAIHGAYTAYDHAEKKAGDIHRGTAVQRHINQWLTERRKIVSQLSRQPDEELVLSKCLPEAEEFLSYLKTQMQGGYYARIIARISILIRMGSKVATFTQKSRKPNMPENECMDCDENTHMLRSLAYAGGTEMPEPFEIKGHLALRFKALPLVFDVYDFRVRTVDECALKTGWTSSRTPSYYYRTPTIEGRASYDSHGRVIGYEDIQAGPSKMGEYDDIVGPLTGQALYFENKGDWKTAHDIHRFALRFNARSVKVRNNLANTANNNGDHESLFKFSQEAVLLDPENASAQMNLGVAFQYRGDRTRAIQCYEEALRIDPNYSTALANLLRIQQS